MKGQLRIARNREAQRNNIAPLSVKHRRRDYIRIVVDFVDSGIQDYGAQLLELVGEDTSGEIDIEKSVPKLAGLIVSVRLSVELDSRTGRSHNALIAIYPEGAS